MDFFVFLILTAFAVSIDSMVAGFAVGLKTKKTWFFAFVVAVATLLLCLLTTLLTTLIQQKHNLVFNFAGSLFLVITGIANFVKKQENTPDKLCFKQYVALGFAVGLDAGIANLSLCLLGYSQLWIPFVFAFMHFATVSFGAKMANTKLTKNIKHTNKISGIILICLGIFKLLQ